MTENQLLDLLEKPQPISVNDLCDDSFEFIIPSYQRGYRWTKKEVLRLLMDVASYNKEKDGNFYCLQPLVVRHLYENGNHIWRVIDGQQRLTTLYLILNYLGIKGTGYSLEYERDNVLSNILDSSDMIDHEENCEVYHLTNSLKAIEEYFANISNIEEHKQLLLDNILNNCSFIMYVMKEGGFDDANVLDDMEHELFNNLNSGKISLTESELIKALFLHNIGETKIVKEIKQISIAEELDNMERVLRENEMWYFLAGDRAKPSNCIDYLYRVWHIAENGRIPNDIDFPIFSMLEEQIYSDNEMLMKWRQLKKCFHIITGWYNAPLTYNLIGYLEGRKVPKNSREKCPPYREELLAQMYRYATKSTSNDKKLPTKKEFIKYVKTLCINSIPDNFINLRFDTDKNAVFNLLFLFNIALMINNKKEKGNVNEAKSTGRGSDTRISRFPFHVFHSLNWNVEHISPQNPKNKMKLYESLLGLKAEYDKLPPEVDALFTKLNKHKDNLDSLDYDTEFISMSQYLIPDKQQVMLLRNLTLLTEHDNKGIGNKFYFDKRNKLNEYQSQGSFIPAATLNVFSKWYTKNPDGYVLWGSKDQDAYLVAIEDTINDFIKFCEDDATE